MARYTGPTTRLSRRFNTPLFGATKAYERRPYPPGQHGPKLRRKLSEFAVGLNEKQKLRYIYGLLERQFRKTFETAKRERGVTGERFLQLLETRLDSVIYLLGFAKSRAAARQSPRCSARRALSPLTPPLAAPLAPPSRARVREQQGAASARTRPSTSRAPSTRPTRR